MEILSRDLIYYGLNSAFYWVTVHRADGSTDRWMQAVMLSYQIPG
jgi:hypothetical protein